MQIPVMHDTAQDTSSNSNFPIKAAFIDMDGTLVDHFNALYRCYKYVAEKLGVKAPSLDLVRRSVGGSMPVTIRKFFDDSVIEEAIEHWRDHFEAIHLEDVVLLKGAHELLDTLESLGIRPAILTNKSGTHTRNIIESLGLTSRFEVMIGAHDTEFRKPQPELSQFALDRMGVAAPQAIMIGDSPFDIETGQCVGMMSYCVTTGSHDFHELEEAGADNIFPDLAELAKYLRSLHPLSA